MAHRYQWPQHWVDQADPEYIEELLTFIVAEGEHSLSESEMTPDEKKAKQRHQKIQRKLNIMDRKEKRGK